MKIFTTVIAMMLIASTFASDGKVVRRIKLLHADPQLIAKILKQENPQHPEYSTVQNTPNQNNGGGTRGGRGN